MTEEHHSQPGPDPQQGRDAVGADPAAATSGGAGDGGSTSRESGSKGVPGSEGQAPAGRPMVSRRAMLAGSGGAAAVFGMGGFAWGHHRGAESAEAASADHSTRTSYPFRGDHQSGILTPAQDSMFTAAFDMRDVDVRLVRSLLRDWSTAAEQMMAGELVGGQPLANRQAAPTDTGDAWDYPPSGLTITFGVGRGLFVDEKGRDRFGLKSRMPKILAEGMPRFANEALQSGQSDGDLLIQACADDSQVAVHAIRNLTRIAFGRAVMRWTQVGYGRTSSTSKDQQTPRNLFGFKDGTNNIKAEDSAAQLNEHLWVQSGDDQGDWMAGGSYFVARKIRMFLEVWDRLRLGEQESTIGRDKMYGAPQSIAAPTENSQEFTAANFTAKQAGQTMIPTDSHIAVVAPEQNKGRRMLRRGYNYTDGIDSLGRLNAGLFFVAFLRDPRTNFYPILTRMTSSDALTEYLQHQASALFAIPPGIGAADQGVAEKLFKGVVA
ncbi:deferrochelatase/peroxidase EfeB [Acidipropionibacterium jensenii]|uniref:Deferrochelatase n=1 Tax=Acidipropionibacterium jensenii TaxID=1749 RepID=A0A3T0S270_9ACTN|nr:iron uptake transporter deferrochelatase/peroxidase subunit [Acidipropionibacterium jensenii]AZZ40474.1 deferrochelatase/peroxidase EfeB [Acidipropionibacterium jensenii]